jgi:hypothetical protein
MDPSQHWCLACGAATPGSLDASNPRRRSAALVLGATVLLVAGAAASAYAAWGKTSPGPRHVVEIVEQAPASTTSPGTAATPPPPAAGAPTTVTPTTSAAKPPKTPAATTTPKSSSNQTNTSSTSTGQNTATSPTSTSEGSTNTTQAQPSPLTLDTNAAATYNPYHYPATRFGDPSLAIDGDTSTAWSAQVDPAVAPRMAEGLVIDLKTPQKLSALMLITSTPGMKVQIYGSDASAVPPSITDPAWVQLSGYTTVKSKHLRIKLRESTKAFRFVTLWISMAPAGSTAQSPGHVSVNEIELFKA